MSDQSLRRPVAGPALTAFAVSLAVILLQLVQTRIFSVVFWNHLVYFIVSIALLGFGVSGTWLAFGRQTFLARYLTPPTATAAFVVAALFSSLLLPVLSVSTPWLTQDGQRIPVLLLIYSVAILPYFFAGWILGTLFRDHAEQMHRLYFADLVGAGLGCVIFLVLLAPLGASRLIVVACAATLLPFLASFLTNTRARVTGGLVIAALVIVASFGDRIDRSIRPESSKNLVADYSDLAPDDGVVIAFSEWNPVARIDVVTTQKQPNSRRIYMDGGAFTPVVSSPPDRPPAINPSADRMISYLAPYLVKPRPAATLVIGSGGGFDVWQAMRAGSQRIDAVELNSTTARLGRGENRAFSNGLFDRPGVTVFNQDGRSFARAQSSRYDLIVIDGIDTFAALNAGAYVLSENYLYSVEAFVDYLGRLAPDGVLAVTRWFQLNEATRVFTTAIAALERLGVQRPASHVIVLAYRRNSEEWASFLISPTPFPDDLAGRIRNDLERSGGTIAFPVSGRPTAEIPRALAGYAQFAAEGRAERYFTLFPYDVRPTSDDSPFFFHYEKWRDALAVVTNLKDGNWIRGNWPSLTLFSLSLFSLIAVILFILLPLLARRGRGASVPHFPAWVVFFTCLGVSFIFVEIALMQRFALLLGHPSLSLAVVLGVLLVSAGIGSLMSNRIGARLPATLAILAALIMAAAFIYPAITTWALALPYSWRVAMVVALVVPLGVLMGMAFPSGIAAVARSGPEGVPWMWGINGGTTVLGSLLAIIIAMASGFTLVLTLAAAGYAIAAVAFLIACRHQAIRVSDARS